MYLPNQEVKYDSIVDFRLPRVAYIKIISRSNDGTLLYKINLKTSSNSNRTDIPLRSEILWSGHKTVYDEKGKRISRERMDNVLF